MKRISYVTDEKGKKIAVQIPLTDYKNIEDLLEGIIAESRKRKKTNPRFNWAKLFKKAGNGETLPFFLNANDEKEWRW